MDAIAGVRRRRLSFCIEGGIDGRNEDVVSGFSEAFRLPVRIRN